MVLQKQKNNPRYKKSYNILTIGLLVFILVVRFGIIIQKSGNDILSLSSQIKYESGQIRKKTNVKVQRVTNNKTGPQVLSGATNTGNQ